MVFKVRKSTLFMHQWRQHARDYKKRVGPEVAERFITAVEEALDFIRQNPYACALYDAGEGYQDLLEYQFRKWSLRGFPHVVLFRLSGDTIFIEVLYALRMDIPSRLADDIRDDKQE